MGSGWNSVKKFSGIESVQKAAKGDMKGAIASNLGSGGIDESLQAVGLKKDKAADEARRKAEAEGIAKNQQIGSDLQDKNEADSAAFFGDQDLRNNKLMGATKKSYGAMDKTSEQLEAGQKELYGEANAQATDARKVYSNLSGKMDTLVNQSEADAKSAMSLQDFMDPSKSKALASVRGMYNDEGASQQGIYDTQAQNEGKSGLADYGVLSSLGAQSMGQGMAGMGPMTAGQQMGLLAQSQRQAGSAYANTQQRMQALRDQGLQANTGLRNQGLTQGMNFHDKAYNAGIDAQGRHKSNIQDRATLTDRDVAVQSGLRGERSGFQGAIAGQQDARSGRALGLSQQKYGLESGLAKDRLGANTALRASKLGLSDKELGQNMGKILREDQAAASEVAANQKMAGTAAAIVAAPYTGGASLGALGAMQGGGGAPQAGAPYAGVQNNMGAGGMLPQDPRYAGTQRNMYG